MLLNLGHDRYYKHKYYNDFRPQFYFYYHAIDIRFASSKIYHVFIDYLDQENGFATKFSYSYVALMLLMMILRQQVGYKSNMYIDKIHYYYRLCSCVECCLSSSLELKVLLQKSHEKLAETPGVDSSDLLLPPPLAATPEPCISFSFGIHSEHSP
jgi:hypothetical protein